jgi:hypothetical protein
MASPLLPRRTLAARLAWVASTNPPLGSWHASLALRAPSATRARPRRLREQPVPPVALAPTKPKLPSSRVLHARLASSATRRRRSPSSPQRVTRAPLARTSRSLARARASSVPRASGATPTLHPVQRLRRARRAAAANTSRCPAPPAALLVLLANTAARPPLRLPRPMLVQPARMVTSRLARARPRARLRPRVPLVSTSLGTVARATARACRACRASSALDRQPRTPSALRARQASTAMAPLTRHPKHTARSATLAVSQMQWARPLALLVSAGSSSRPLARFRALLARRTHRRAPLARTKPVPATLSATASAAPTRLSVALPARSPTLRTQTHRRSQAPPS